MEEQPYFITVSWCNGPRAILCTQDGGCYRAAEQHSEEEMNAVLGAFWLILAPESRQYTQDELNTFHTWRPLAEYQNQWGIALPKEA